MAIGAQANRESIRWIANAVSERGAAPQVLPGAFWSKREILAWDVPAEWNRDDREGQAARPRRAAGLAPGDDEEAKPKRAKAFRRSGKTAKRANLVNPG